MSTTSRYETLLLLGTGGMASVHVGRLRGIEGFSRLVALKRAHPHVKEDVALANTMRVEATISSRLHHTNVVSILDVEDDAGDLVLVLDYVEGCTLSTLLATMDGAHPREIVRILLDVAAGLHAAHNATDAAGEPLNLVHRDVSPSNVLLGTDGVARVSDFGIAKARLAGRERTETGILKGKASYMAPEYVLHQRADAASDLFSLGIVAWEALTGTRLFKGATELDTLNRVISATTHPMAEHDPRLAPLDDVVLRALSRLPEDRQASVDEFAAELAAVADAHDLLGSYLEVSVLVESVAAEELVLRRREIARSAPSFTGELPPLPSERARDDVDTKTLALPAEAPTSVRTLVAPASRASRRTTLPEPEVLQDPIAPSIPAPPASFRRQEARPAVSREKLGLAGALALLVLALIVLAAKMRSNETVVTATPSAAAPASTAPEPVAPSAAAFEAPPPPEEPTLDVDGAAPRITRPAHRRVYPATQPALMPRKAPPNPYGK